MAQQGRAWVDVSTDQQALWLMLAEGGQALNRRWEQVRGMIGCCVRCIRHA